MSFKPAFQLRAAGPAGGETEKQRFLFVNVRAYIETVQREEHFHGSVGDTFVAVHEWVVEGSEYASAAALPVTVG